MGLLDRWLKKKTAAQLNKDTTTPSRGPVEAEKPGKESPAKEAPVEMKKETKRKTDTKAVTKDTSDQKVEVVKTEKKTEVFPRAAAQKVKNAVYHKLISPLVTEKSNLLQAHNQYVFEVARDATKEDVKQAIQELYSIKPLSVNIINVQGKFVRFGRRLGRRSDFKKAIVTLPEGSTIKINETV